MSHRYLGLRLEEAGFCSALQPNMKWPQEVEPPRTVSIRDPSSPRSPRDLWWSSKKHDSGGSYWKVAMFSSIFFLILKTNRMLGASRLYQTDSTANADQEQQALMQFGNNFCTGSPCCGQCHQSAVSDAEPFKSPSQPCQAWLGRPLKSKIPSCRPEVCTGAGWSSAEVAQYCLWHCCCSGPRLGNAMILTHPAIF